MKLSVVAANDLRSGAVVYLDPEGGWTRRLAQAATAEGDAAADLLARAAPATRGNLIVGATLREVRLEGGAPIPLTAREIIRARGPSVRPDLSILDGEA